jgi:hypothetical protein
MSKKNIVERAADVTTAAEMHISEACGYLTASRETNGFGVYADRAAVRANLRSAATEIAAAAVILIGDWPTPDDYEKQS